MPNQYAFFRAKPPFRKEQWKLQIKENKRGFSFVTNVKQLSNQQYTNIQLSQKHFLGKF